MEKPLDELRERLLGGGVAPRHVRRYLRELAEHLADLRAEEMAAGRSAADADAAALSRLGSVEQLASAMLGQRQFQSWSARAPWVMFSAVQLLLLASLYVVALLILWSGWQLFLPDADTPFVDVHGFAVVYFGIGHLLYNVAPILVGWGIGLIAMRQRLAPGWPAAGMALIAWMGGAVQVEAGRTAVPVGFAHIRVDVSPWFFAHSVLSALPLLATLALTMLPYFIWRVREPHSLLSGR